MVAVAVTGCLSQTLVFVYSMVLECSGNRGTGGGVGLSGYIECSDNRGTDYSHLCISNVSSIHSPGTVFC